jgi:hypothetical protein
MAAAGGAAATTPATTDRDLTDNAAPNPSRVGRWGILDHADKFVPWDARKSCVPL